MDFVDTGDSGLKQFILSEMSHLKSKFRPFGIELGSMETL